MNQNLKLRIITALIGLPIILCVLIFGGTLGATFFAWVISTGMLFEFSKFTFTLPDQKFKTYLAQIFSTAIFLLNLMSTGLSHSMLGLIPMLLFTVVFLFRVPTLLILTKGQDEALVMKQHVQELMGLCFAFVYCTWLPLLMVKISEHHQGVRWLILTLFAVFATDTGAYFAGKFFGSRKLFPVISPKKTWEGAIGGLFLTLIIGLIYCHFFLPLAALPDIAIILTLMSVASQLGDLSESLIKRAANIKDSGGLLPGHGGFMDRFDGVLFALPVMAAYLWIFSGF